MNLKALVVTLATFDTIAAHTVFTTLFVNDANQGDGTCVRMLMSPTTATYPINDLTGLEMVCGHGGAIGVARVCAVPQSSKLSFLFRTYPDSSEPGSLDPSHKGPCAVYMKAVASATKDKGIGDGWFKIWDEGYDSESSQWCTEKLIKNNGFLSVRIPNLLAGGYYLVRPELLSLHEADKIPPNPQFYVGCAQIFLDSKATSIPDKTVEIPGYVTIKDPSVLFNIYTPHFPYTLPGPARYTSGSPSSKTKAVTTQAEGLLPGKVILTNANWWGVEVASYTTEDGCWAASKSCWDQCTKCYDTAPPTGSKNCKIWEKKCETLGHACNSMNIGGPPDAGKDLNPPIPVFSRIPDAEEAAATNGSKAPTIIEAQSRSKSAGTTLTTTLTENSIYAPFAPVNDADRPKPSPQSSNAKSITSSSTTTSSYSISPVLTITPIESTISTSPIPILVVSEDAKCGGFTNQTCLGSRHGPCCSFNGWCGDTEDYCMKCQPIFGKCGALNAAGKRHHHGRARHA